MNILFLSPALPPNAYLFCLALARHGARAIGVGDSPLHDVRGDLRDALKDYVFVPSLADYDSLYRATAGLIARHGRLDAVEAQIEIWLETAARLSEDFRVPGLTLEELQAQRSKSGMAQIFGRAKIASPPGIASHDVGAIRRFAEHHGFPLVFKPDTGAGAVRTFTVHSAKELEDALRGPIDHYIIQPFIKGDIVTYDGLVDAHGHIVFSLTHRYDTGIMQVVSGGLDGHYVTQRDMPEALDAIGRRAVAAFGVRRRFFHLEFFETDAGYVALEMNLRAPGGFTTDMMNYACDFDVYDLWARAMVGESLRSFAYQRRYAVGHAGRRDHRQYELSHDDLVRELGTSLVYRRRLPDEFSAMQGNEMYLIRHPDLAVVQRGIELVQRRI